MGKPDELVPGTLDMLILKTLSPGDPEHGYAIANSIQQTSEEVLKVDEGRSTPRSTGLRCGGWSVEVGFLREQPPREVPHA